MKYRWLTVFACLLFAGCSGSSDDNARVVPNGANPEPVVQPETKPKSTETEPVSPADHFAAIQARYESAMQEFMTAYQAADEKDRDALAKEKYPKGEEYSAEFMKLATDNPDSDVAFDSLNWIVSHTRGEEVAEKALETLFSNYLDKESFKDLCTTISYSEPSPLVESRLNLLIDKSPHDNVKASAIFALASYLARLEPTRQYIADNPEEGSYSDEIVKYLTEREVEPMEIEALYQTLVSDYPDLKPREGSKRTYKSKAESALFELNNLAIGMVAPDIGGDDLDGVTFNLRDYRGKVVVLDFWGDW